MSEQKEVLVITRAKFATLDIERMTAVRKKALNVLAEVSGMLSTTLWERHDDPFGFMTVGHFQTEADSLAAWNALVASPVMDVMAEIMTEVPNTLRFYVNSQTGVSIEKTHEGTFCSLSTRIADIGYGPAMLKELKGIFEELKFIHGFQGGITGQMIDVSDEILGLAFWDSKDAFEASLPKKSMYRIDLFQRVL